jgi:hypothetical protein
MSQPGKFIPGGARKTTSVGVRTGPIRAPDGSTPPSGPGKKGGNRLFSKGSLTRPVPKDRRIPIMIMSGFVCFLLVSGGWYGLGVLPAKRAAEAESEKAAAAQKQLADEMAAQQAAADAAKKKAAAARATVTIASTPAGTATIGTSSLPTPATFSDVIPGKIIVSVQAPGYRAYHQELNVTAEQPTDLGTIQLVPQTGNLSLSSDQTDAGYTLTGPNGYEHDGQFPEKLSGLAAGDYQLIAHLGDWKLAPLPITLHDQDDLQKMIKFPYGSVGIDTVPPGATIRNGNTVLGISPMKLPQARPGTMNLTADLPPYDVARFSVNVPEAGNVNQQVQLEQGKDFIAACGMPMVWIPDGGYWAGKYDVSQRVFEGVTNYNPSTFRRPTRPVETVSWDEAMAFCDKLNQSEARAGTLPRGYHYTLPTELQWETFSADADINLAATSRSSTLSSTQDVGASEPNKYGLYDTIGNVWEWCLDNFDNQGNHSLRGGNWLSSTEDFPSADTRNAGGPKYADRFTGFRVVLVPDK